MVLSTITAAWRAWGVEWIAIGRVASGRGNRPPRVRGVGGSNGRVQSTEASVTRVSKKDKCMFSARSIDFDSLSFCYYLSLT